MEKKLSVYEEVMLEIEKRIKEQVYTTSQRLPSEYELSDELAVSRLTVRKAINELVNQEVLFKQRGKGTYVMAKQNKVQSGRSGLQSFTEAAKAYGKKSMTKILKFEKLVDVPAGIREELELKETEGVYHIIRLRSFNEEPMTLEELYVNEDYLPKEMSQALLEEISLFDLIERKIAIAYSHQEVEAVQVTESLSQTLKIMEGLPIMQVHSKTFSVNATPILYDISYYRADKYSFKQTLYRK